MALRHLLAAGTMMLAIAGFAPAADAQQPQFAAITDEFLPGERTIFFDDFSDMLAGSAPARFRVRGAAPELMASGAVRELRFSANGTLTPNLTALPANFTWEAEVQLTVPAGIARVYLIMFAGDREAVVWMLGSRTNQADMYIARKVPRYEELGRTPLRLNLAQPQRLALWVQDGRLRAFVNGEKKLDVNQVMLPAIDRVELRTEFLGAGPSAGWRWVRFAESAPDFGDVLMATGRYVSHGILFDTDSDRMKIESAPAIKRIAQVLAANPQLRLLIEGHTDDVGEAAHNLDLSHRRAEAVMHVLTAQFGIEAARLTCAGVGASRPLEPNTTPQGRAQNRRVEFVRQ